MLAVNKPNAPQALFKIKLKVGSQLEWLMWLHQLVGSSSTDTGLNLLCLELERVPEPAWSPGPEEKLALNKPNTRHYPGPNLGQACELFDKLDKARETVGYTRLEKSSKNIKGSLGSRIVPTSQT